WECEVFCVLFSSRRRHTRSKRDWSSDVCSSDLGMVIGLLIAIFITYRKDRVPTGIEIETSAMQADEKTVLKFEKKHFFTLIAIVVALVIQIVTQDLIVAALSGLIILFITVAVPFR